jgi:hypothetical protein
VDLLAAAAECRAPEATTEEIKRRPVASALSVGDAPAARPSGQLVNPSLQRARRVENFVDAVTVTSAHTTVCVHSCGDVYLHLLQRSVPKLHGDQMTVRTSLGGHVCVKV